MDPRLAGVLADLAMVAHFAFVLFVVLGALTVLWRRWMAALHIPCALYGVAIELFGWVCPLTPVEQDLRQRAGEAGYEGGFVDHYIGSVLYPADWSEIHTTLGWLLLAFNLALYGFIFFRRRRDPARRSEADRHAA